MKAIIVGAGIAGLVAARQLGLSGWQVLVLERSASPRPDGYMMDFFGPGVEASEQIGLYPYLSQVAYQVEAAEYVDPSGRVTASLDYRTFADLAGGKVLSLLRPDMEHAARKALQEVPEGQVELRYGVHIQRMQLDGAKVRLWAGDGQEVETADLLIGADGIHSALRTAFFGPEQDFLRPLGMRAAAFIVQEPELNQQLKNRFVLSDTVDRTAGIYGLRDGQVASFLVYRQDPTAKLGESADRLRRIFAGTNQRVDRLLELSPANPYDDVVAQVVMPCWHHRSVVLIGDAAAAVSLLAGQGGAMAVCAAAALGNALGEVSSKEQIPAALAEYERVMRPKISTAQASGRRAANSFLPRHRLGLLWRRLILRSTKLPGVDRLVAGQIVKRLAK